MGRGTRLIATCALLLLLIVSCESAGVGTAPRQQCAPLVGAPPIVALARGYEGSFLVSVNDLWGCPITEIGIKTSNLPVPNSARITDFTPNGSFAHATFRWTPGASDTGVYTVTFFAVSVSGLGSNPPPVQRISAPTLIYTTDHVEDAPPVVHCPDTLHIPVGVAHEFAASAEDPDGDPLFSFERPSGVYNDATWQVQVEGPKASGVLQTTWLQPGWVPVVFTARNALSGTCSTIVHVIGPDVAINLEHPPLRFGTCSASPESVHLKAGETVGWKNACRSMTLIEDSGHFRVESAYNTWTTPLQLPGPGVYPYHSDGPESEADSVRGVIFVDS